MHQRTRLLIVLLFLGLLVRLLLVPRPGFEGDIGFWKSWSKAASENLDAVLECFIQFGVIIRPDYLDTPACESG